MSANADETGGSMSVFLSFQELVGVSLPVNPEDVLEACELVPINELTPEQLAGDPADPGHARTGRHMAHLVRPEGFGPDADD